MIMSSHVGQRKPQLHHKTLVCDWALVHEVLNMNSWRKHLEVTSVLILCNIRAVSGKGCPGSWIPPCLASKMIRQFLKLTICCKFLPVTTVYALYMCYDIMYVYNVCKCSSRQLEITLNRDDGEIWPTLNLRIIVCCVAIH